MALTKIKGAGINISATEKLYFDGGGTTYIQESADGVLDFYADNVKMLELLEGGTDYVWIPVDATKLAIGAGKDLNIYTSSDDAIIENITSDKDLLFKGNDGGSTITALTFDMSDAGKATFNNHVVVSDRVVGSGDLILVTTDSNEKIHMDSDGYIKFETAGTEAVRIDSSGRVGIAQDTPGDFDAGSDDLVIGNSSGNRGMTIRCGTSNSGTIAFADGTTGDQAYRGIVAYDHSTDSLQFKVNGASEKMRIDSAGKVGINTTTMDAFLNINSGADNSGLHVESTDGGANLSLADNSGSVVLQGLGGALVVEGGGSAGTAGSSATERFKIDSDGATKISANSASNYGLYVHNDGDNTNRFGIKIQCGHQSSGTNTFINFFESDGGNHGSITQSGTTTAYNTSSDYRLKENEKQITDGLEKLNKLKPYNFNFKKYPDKKVDGFFAHEVSSIVPEAVVGEKDAVDSDGNIKAQQIDQSKLVPLLVKAVQELSAKVEALENE